MMVISECSNAGWASSNSSGCSLMIPSSFFLPKKVSFHFPKTAAERQTIFIGICNSIVQLSAAFLLLLFLFFLEVGRALLSFDSAGTMNKHRGAEGL
jgi:hypothetical protein